MRTYPRRSSREIKIGGVIVGGKAPVSVQSMTNTDTRDVKATLEQIERLHEAGAELVRLAVPDLEAARCIRDLVRKSPLPLIADIHFDHRLALTVLEGGIQGLRLNPGNMKKREHVEAVVEAAQKNSVPIRIGVNGGSLSKEILARFGGPTPEAMVESALEHIRILESLDFNLIKVSLKSHDVPTTIEAYRQLAEITDYPLHIGITEAGTPLLGSIRSGVGLGILLFLGIGDTLRVSLTGDPVEEVFVGYEILKSLKMREHGATLVSCPTCGRCRIDLIPLAQKVEVALRKIMTPMTVAVMGCAVNGPGEAREADVGIAGGEGKAVIFRHGEIVRTVPEEEMFTALMEEVRRVSGEK
ncbi:MAG TPA: 4-hydroxy-3-methylbut-2-en-1-yl diphosphate synthase [Cyanobacteria bacterium UBA8530]|nr:4-hydroxy-3-methylbut-2-en-1-yl diphosphate synthase [Cyanobacteria bacterium UBA8530]